MKNALTGASSAPLLSQSLADCLANATGLAVEVSFDNVKLINLVYKKSVWALLLEWLTKNVTNVLIGASLLACFTVALYFIRKGKRGKKENYSKKSSLDKLDSLRKVNSAKARSQRWGRVRKGLLGYLHAKVHPEGKSAKRSIRDVLESAVGAFSVPLIKSVLKVARETPSIEGRPVVNSSTLNDANQSDPMHIPPTSPPSNIQKKRSFKNAGRRILQGSGSLGDKIANPSNSNPLTPLQSPYLSSPYAIAQAKQTSLVNRRKLTLLKSKLGLEAASSIIDAGNETDYSVGPSSVSYRTSNPATSTSISLPSEDI